MKKDQHEKEIPTERPTMKSMRKAIFITMHIPLYTQSIDIYLEIIYIYVCVCREREREREKKQLIITTITEKF